jgi:DNA-binding NarL/FixJ family response regulator
VSHANNHSAEKRLSGRVVIVEDQRLVAELFAAHCRKLGLEVIAQCGTLAEALPTVRQHRPDLVLMDFSLPDGDGLQVAAQLMGEIATLRVIGVSSHRDPWTMLQVQRSGLHGFVDKNEQRPEILAEAIEAVLFGRTFYTSIVGQSSSVIRHDRNAFVHVLSDYELRILALIGEAKDDIEIAAILGISSSTAQSRRRDIMRKLDIHSTPKLIHYALSQGIVRTDHITTPKKK